MGHVRAPPVFVSAYGNTVSEWNQELYAEDEAYKGLVCKVPFVGSPVDLSLTMFVDDVARAVPATGAQESSEALIERAARCTQLLVERMNEA